ncbi:MAG: hypothetical protein GX047_05175 [Firmicutes bacterium]|nr:hypothetical protein [Bacillota bacterium]
MRSLRTDCSGERGQAILEYVLVLSAVAIPLIWATKHMQHQMAAFIRNAVTAISLWSIGIPIY